MNERIEKDLESIHLSEHILSNGIRVLTAEMPHARRMAIHTQINAGSLHDPVGQEGLAHFNEHMAFAGTDSRDNFAIAWRPKLRGANFNARTTHHVTRYELSAYPTEHAKEAFDWMTDVVLRPVMPPEKLETQRTVILDEILQACHSPTAIHAKDLWKSAVGNSPIIENNLGPDESVRRITAQDLLAAREKLYVGRNMIISVAGPLSHAQMIDAIEARFGNVSAGEKSKKIERIEFRPTAIFNPVAHIGQVLWTCSVQGAPYNEAKKRSIESITSRILGGDLSSRLMQHVREEKGLTYNVCTNIQVSGFERLAVVAATSCQESDIDKTIAAVGVAWRSMRDDLTDIEIEAEHAFMEESHEYLHLYSGIIAPAYLCNAYNYGTVPSNAVLQSYRNDLAIKSEDIRVHFAQMLESPLCHAFTGTVSKSFSPPKTMKDLIESEQIRKLMPYIWGKSIRTL